MMDPKWVFIWATGAIVLILLLTGCSNSSDARVAPVHTQDVFVPILDHRTVPPEILRTPVPAADIPFFLRPGDKAATSCLAPSGEAKVRALLIDRENRLDWWEKWGF